MEKEFSYVSQDQSPEVRYEVLSAEFLRSIRNTHRLGTVVKKDYIFFERRNPSRHINSHDLPEAEYAIRQEMLHFDPEVDWERMYHYEAQDTPTGCGVEITHYEGFLVSMLSAEKGFEKPVEAIEVNLELDSRKLSDMEIHMINESGLDPLLDNSVNFVVDEKSRLILPDQAVYLINNGVFEDHADFLDFYCRFTHQVQTEGPAAAYENVFFDRVAANIEKFKNEAGALPQEELSFEEEVAYYVCVANTVAEISDFVIRHAPYVTDPDIRYIRTMAFGSSSGDDAPGEYQGHRIVTGIAGTDYLIDQCGHDVLVHTVLRDTTQALGAFPLLAKRFLDNPNFHLGGLAQDMIHPSKLGFRVEQENDPDEIAFVLRKLCTTFGLR